MIFRQRKPRSAAPPEPTDPEIAAADAHERGGELLEAIACLTRANRRLRDPNLDRRILRLRHLAGAGLSNPDARRQAPVEPDHEALPNGATPPDIDPEQLTAELLRAGILRDGCLLVRGLVERDQALRLAGEIDKAFDAAAADADGKTRDDGYFEKFDPQTPNELGFERRWVSTGGGIWIADSPRVLFEVLDTLERSGLQRVIADYLGERPALSVNKGTLRRVRPDIKASGVSAWHQDGAFLGEVRAVNVWLSLSRCGDVAPGLDLVPRRLDHIVPTGTDGAAFDWSVSQEIAEEAAGEVGVRRPIFEPGDVLLFDELFLHATATDARMSETRYAVESWFFGPSGFPSEYVPLAF